MWYTGSVMKIIALAAQKGGTAKTTTCINLGHALAEAGKRVLLVDMDPQGQIAEGFGIPADTLDREISQTLESNIPLFIQNVRPNLDIAPSNINLAYVEPHLYSMMRREDLLKRALSKIPAGLDYVLIDCPPSLGILTINALSAADTVLIPMAADYYSMLGVNLLLKTIESVREQINPNLSIMGIIPTRVGRTINAREVLESVQDGLGESIHVLTSIPETVKFREAVGLGKTILEHATNSPAAESYRTLAKEVLING